MQTPCILPFPLRPNHCVSSSHLMNLRSSSLHRELLLSLKTFACVTGVAAVKSTKSNLNIRIPRSYQYCSKFMKSGRKPPSESDIVHPFDPTESFHCGAALICTSALLPNHIPGRMPFSLQAAIHLSGPVRPIRRAPNAIPSVGRKPEGIHHVVVEMNAELAQ